jgi:hypothetical protein
MRAVTFYFIVACLIIRAVEGAEGAPGIGAVQLDAARLVTSVNKSELIESDASIRRVSLGNPDMIEVVAVSSRPR